MTFEETLSEHGAWLLVAIACVAFIYHAIGKLNHQAALFHEARMITKDFYEKADNLLGSPDVPDFLKGVIYDMTLAVTRDNYGQLALRALRDIATRPAAQPDRRGTRISESVAALRRANPMLADDFDETLRMGFAAVVCGYGHTDDSLTVTIVKNSGRESLASSAAAIRDTISAPQLAAAA